jgi:two-component system, NarL family, nitrate/nitrite response regulator NarL
MSPPVVPRASKGAQQIRVLIAERDRMACQLLAESLERDSRFQVVAVPPAAEVVSVAALRKPDVAVISADFISNARKGLQIAHALSLRLPSIHIVILLDSLARELVVTSFRSGATGVFCRTDPIAEFRTCVAQVSRGEIWARDVAAEHLLRMVRSSPWCDTTEGNVHPLSKREIEVAECAVQGQTNKQIAGQLQLSEHTVKNYLFRIFEKLGVSNRMELLFFLSAHNKDAGVPVPDLTVSWTNSLAGYLRAAEEGWVSAQFMLGLVYLEGRGAEKNQQSAYYWLRMAEENSSEVQEHSRMLIEGLKDRMTSEDIEELERILMTQKDKLLVKRLADNREDVNGAVVSPLRIPA